MDSTDRYLGIEQEDEWVEGSRTKPGLVAPPVTINNHPHGGWAWRRSTPEAPETEKVTINLGHVDLGRINLLVQEGFYSNRTDFMAPTPIRPDRMLGVATAGDLTFSVRAGGRCSRVASGHRQAKPAIVVFRKLKIGAGDASYLKIPI